MTSSVSTAFLSLLALASLSQLSAHRRKVVGCEGSRLELYCEGDKVISVLRANYGRISNSVCGDNRGQNWSTRCIQPRTLREVTSRCSSNSSGLCSLEVSSSVFGDPCPNTPKYLEVVYTCQKREKVPEPPMLPPWLMSLEAMENIIRRKPTSMPSTSTTSTTSISPTTARREEKRVEPSTEFLVYLQQVKERERRVSLMLNNPRELPVVQAEPETSLDRDVIAAIVIAALATLILLVAVIIVFCCSKSRTKSSQAQSDLETSSSTYLSYGLRGNISQENFGQPGNLCQQGLRLENNLPFSIKCGQAGETYEYAEINYKDSRGGYPGLACRLANKY